MINEKCVLFNKVLHQLLFGTRKEIIFCPHCGKPAKESVSAFVKCPQCDYKMEGKVAQDYINFCPNDGCKLVEEN